MDKFNPKSFQSILIPVGTPLFRRSENNEFHPLMFFSFSYHGTASVLHRNKHCGLWKVVQPFTARIAMRKGISNPNHYLSELDVIYQAFYGEKEDYLNLKHYRHPKRNDFFKKLSDIGLTPLVNSIENTTEIEIIFYGDRTAKLVAFDRYLDFEKDQTLIKSTSFKNLTSPKPISS